MNLPYRPNVSIVAVLKDRFIVVRRPEWAEEHYKFPQGGIRSDEDVTDAATREMREELGVEGEVIGVSSLRNRYDWPDPIPPYRGQDQRFVAVRVNEDARIAVDGVEIVGYRLVDRDTVLGWNRARSGAFADYNGIIEDVLDELGL